MIPVRYHCDNTIFDFDGMEVTYWAFDKTSIDSFNLFADVTLSRYYLLEDAIESREKNV